jgi:hypothetical protein
VKQLGTTGMSGRARKTLDSSLILNREGTDCPPPGTLRTGLPYTYDMQLTRFVFAHMYKVYIPGHAYLQLTRFVFTHMQLTCFVSADIHTSLLTRFVQVYVDIYLYVRVYSLRTPCLDSQDVTRHALSNNKFNCSATQYI